MGQNFFDIQYHHIIDIHDNIIEVIDRCTNNNKVFQGELKLLLKCFKIFKTLFLTNESDVYTISGTDLKSFFFISF